MSDGDVMKGKNKCISQTYAGGEMGDRGLDGWMASSTQWT